MENVNTKRSVELVLVFHTTTWERNINTMGTSSTRKIGKGSQGKVFKIENVWEMESNIF